VSDDARLRDRVASAILVLFVVASLGTNAFDLVLEHAVVPIDHSDGPVVLVELGIYGALTAVLTPARVRSLRAIGCWLTSLVALELTNRFLGPPEGLAGHPLLVLDAALAVVAALALSVAFWYRIVPDEPLAGTPLGD